MSEHPATREIQFDDGRSVDIHTCRCGTCENVWYVRGDSDEWLPNFCCYCGVIFNKLTYDGVSREYHGAGQGPENA